MVLGISFDCVALGVESSNCRSTIHDFALVSVNWIALSIKKLDCLPFSFTGEVPYIFGISRQEWHDNQSIRVLRADKYEHVGNINYHFTRVMHMVDNMLKFAHVRSESLHDATVGRNIKEQVNRCIQDTVKNIAVNSFDRTVYHRSLEPFFEDGTRCLDSHNCEDSVNMCPELGLVNLFFFIICPVTDHVATLSINESVQSFKPNYYDELEPMTVVVHQSRNCRRLNFSLLVHFIVNNFPFFFILDSPIFEQFFLFLILSESIREFNDSLLLFHT